jgi:ABC-type sugar transport system ATPase subunit
MACCSEKMNMAKVEFKNVSKAFDGKKILDGFNLEIKDCEFLVLVGPSGCGKSTTLRLLSGLDSPTSGEIWMDGHSINRVDPKDRDIAMVFQNYALYPHMTVFENLAFGLKIRKVLKSEIEKRVREVARMLEIEGLLDRKPKALSGGQRQRVAVGRAVIRSPKVFLMDEPLSNLDAKLRVQMRGELLELQRRLKTTTLYVTHDQVEAMTMGDRIVVLHEGKIQQIGEPSQIYHSPANRFVAGFIGSPPMNFLERGHLTIGVRPEHIKIQSSNEIKAWGIQGRFLLLEPLGGESLVHIDIEGTRWIARMLDHRSFQNNEKLSLSIPIDKVMFFDEEKEGARIETKGELPIKEVWKKAA